MFKRMFQRGDKGRDRAALLESTGQAGEVSDSLRPDCTGSRLARGSTHMVLIKGDGSFQSIQQCLAHLSLVFLCAFILIFFNWRAASSAAPCSSCG